MRNIVSHLILIFTCIILIVTGYAPWAQAQLTPGDILFVDHDAGTGSRGSLFKVNPSNGNRTVISDFGNSNQGPLGDAPYGVAIGSGGSILVVDHNGPQVEGALFSRRI